MEPIYLDYNATTPIDPQVAEAMLPFVHQHYGNPSSSHPLGVIAHAAVEEARDRIAKMLGCQPQEGVFTSGGTEANNYAIKGVAGAYSAKGNHIITSSIEHPAVEEVCRYLEGQGCIITYLPVDGLGVVYPEQVEEALTRLNPASNSIEDEITYRFQLQQAIDTLPEDERRVINMIFAEIPSESKDPEVQTISKLLGCGPQTVRNRRDRAVEKLQKMLGTEVKNVS